LESAVIFSIFTPGAGMQFVARDGRAFRDVAERNSMSNCCASVCCYEPRVWPSALPSTRSALGWSCPPVLEKIHRGQLVIADHRRRGDGDWFLVFFSVLGLGPEQFPVILISGSDFFRFRVSRGAAAVLGGIFCFDNPAGGTPAAPGFFPRPVSLPGISFGRRGGDFFFGRNHFAFVGGRRLEPLERPAKVVFVAEARRFVLRHASNHRRTVGSGHGQSVRAEGRNARTCSLKLLRPVFSRFAGARRRRSRIASSPDFFWGFNFGRNLFGIMERIHSPSLKFVRNSRLMKQNAQIKRLSRQLNRSTQKSPSRRRTV